MIRRIVAMSVALTFVSFAAAQADDPGGEDIVVPPPAVVIEEEPVVDDGPDYARNGPYLGVGGTYAFQNFPSRWSNSGDSLGVNARVGYRLHPNVSTELEIEWLEGFNASDRNADIQGWTLTANAKGYLMTGRTQPFLLVGLGLMQFEDGTSRILRGSANTNTEAFAARFGGGVDLYATENIVISVGADYVLPANALKKIDYVAVQWGLLYRF